MNKVTIETFRMGGRGGCEEFPIGKRTRKTVLSLVDFFDDWLENKMGFWDDKDRAEEVARAETRDNGNRILYTYEDFDTCDEILVVFNLVG